MADNVSSLSSVYGYSVRWQSPGRLWTATLTQNGLRVTYVTRSIECVGPKGETHERYFTLDDLMKLVDHPIEEKGADHECG